MKKILLIAGFGFIMSSSLFSQAVMQGNIVIDPYIGGPNTKNMNTYDDPGLSFVDALVVGFDENDVVDGTFKTLGGLLSYGGRVEYLLSDQFGIGVDFNYMKAGFETQVVDSLYNTQTMQYDSLAIYNLGKTKATTRAMVRLTYHFIQNDRVDAYSAFAAGLKIVKRVVTNDSPYGFDEPLLGEDALIPIALRIAVGTRIYFTDNIGMNLELGLLGGSILQAGISVKI